MALLDAAGGDVAVPAAERTGYELHAYRMLPRVFDSGESKPFELPKMEIEPLTEEFELLGYDAVGYFNGFACSPLSCNSMAEAIETNEHCLLQSLDVAKEVAMRFSQEEPEPGPYYVVEVLRRRAIQ